MASLEIRNLSFRYPGAPSPALKDVSLTIRKGEFFVLCGTSGCGKTTLLRLIKPALAPEGLRSGSITLDGVPVETLDARAQASRIGFVQQNPDHALVTDRVWHELAFGLESLGLPSGEIRRRSAEMAAFFGIEDWYDRDVSTLSGGQKQTLALASAMAMNPDLLLLDEPTAQLDPIAAQEFLSAAVRLNRELGVTVLLCEHRLEDVLPLAARAAVLDAGAVIACAAPRELGDALRGHPMFAAMPAAMRIRACVPDPSDAAPVTVSEGRAWLSDYTRSHPAQPLPVPALHTEKDAPSVRLSHVFFRYSKDGRDVLRDTGFCAYPGEIHALLGGNGAGKSTLLSLISGQQRPLRGRMELPFAARTALLPQDPGTLFIGKTVRQELLEALRGSGLSPQQRGERVREMLAAAGLSALAERHPYDLSGGEQQRAALGIVLLQEPRVLLLDEPTKGLDAAYKPVLASLLRRLADSGVSIIMVSHDTEFCASYADRCSLLFDGQIAACDTPRVFFQSLSFYTTAACRMSRGLIENAVTAEDCILALGGTLPEAPEPPASANPPESSAPPDSAEPSPDIRETPPGSRRKTGILLAAAVAAMLLTVLAGVYLFGDRRYYLVSSLILAESIIPFYVLFERRRPRARELVLLASLCAIGVAGRAAFFMLPSFKPVLALVILTGVALGGESGFLVGATTAFVSNFFFGQGPWTPWQMLAYGLSGLLSGLLHRARLLPARRAPLSVYGALCALILYGGIMNPASVLMYQSEPTAGMLLASYAAGLPVDLVHAAATFLFLLLFSEGFLEKIERLRTKYGLIPS